MRKTTKKILGYFSLAGFLIPCLLYFAILVGHVEVGGGPTWVLLIAWPSFPLVMSAEAGGGAAGEFVAFLISAVANALVYASIAGAVAAIYSRLSGRQE